MHLRCGDFFFNPELAGDPFFCKITNITCLDEDAPADFIAQFKKYRMTPYLYLEADSEFEKRFENQFKLYDTQHVLIKPHGTVNQVHACQVTPQTSTVWTDIFCRAYDCSNWFLTVDRIVNKSMGSIGYYVDESYNSCVALIETGSILGLYCLGTAPEMRGRGHAASLIEFAMSELDRKGLDFLMLETYGRDNLLDFYSKLGFEEAYRKKVYTT